MRRLSLFPMASLFLFAACSQGSAEKDIAPVSAAEPQKIIFAAPKPVIQPLPQSDKKPASAPPSPKRMKIEKPKPDPRSPLDRVTRANKKARVQPAGEGFVNAVQIYPWAEGSLYQVYTAPGQISDIALEPGERLIGSGAIAAGDTVRWIIGDTVSGSGKKARVHILVKPVASRLTTNLVINTDRRTYHLELRSNAKAYMASVSWTYPKNVFGRAAVNQYVAAPAHGDGPALENLNFGYKISGDKPAWRPVRVFDDGRQVFVIFPDSISTTEMPPIFVIGADGEAQLVNYRVRGKVMIVDQFFERAELRLGSKKQQIVRIARKRR